MYLFQNTNKLNFKLIFEMKKDQSYFSCCFYDIVDVGVEVTADAVVVVAHLLC